MNKVSFLTDAPAITFCKFGQREHIEKFVTGTLYMNTLEYFAEVEATNGDDPRSDRYEGAQSMWQAKDVVLSIRKGDEWLPIGGLTGPIVGYLKRPDWVKIFCMYSIFHQEGSQLVVDAKNLQFGDAFAIVLKKQEFLERVRRVCKDLSLDVRMGQVKYFDENIHNGPLSPFTKRMSFSYQAEFRVAITHNEPGVFELEIGNLSDIVFVGALSELNDRLALIPNGADTLDDSGG